MPIDRSALEGSWGCLDMTPNQVFVGTFVLILIFAALVAFLTLSAAH